MRRDEPSRMALSDNDHIEALRNRLLGLERNLEKDYQMKLAEIREMIRVLGDAPKLLAGVKLPIPGLAKREAELYKQHGVRPRQETTEEKHRTLANRNVTTLVRNWLAEYRKYDEKIEINDIVTYLKANGCVGKDRSLYSAVHVILKKEEVTSSESENPPWLRYKAGVGFYKTLNDHDPLVAQV